MAKLISSKESFTAKALRPILPIVLSTLGRIVFGLGFAAILVAVYASEVSVEFFQILLLQTIFVTFVSGSGYGRAVTEGENEGGARRMVEGYGFFLLSSIALVILLETAVLPREVVDRFVTPDRWKIYVLLVGGAATGLYGILQGLVVRQAGNGRVFLPNAAVGLVFTLALPLFLVFHPPAGTLLLLFVGYQIATLLAFLAVNARFLRPLFAGKADWRNSIFSNSASSLAIGGVNTLVLLIFFLFRELWSERVDPAVAEAAFFAVRISETYLGVLFYFAAGSTMLKGLRHRISAQLLTRAALGLAAVLIALIGAAFLGASLAEIIPLLVLCLGMQLICEVLRIPGSFATLFELQYGTARSFALVALPATLLAALVSLQTTAQWPLFSFFLFQLLMSSGQIGSAIANRALSRRDR